MATVTGLTAERMLAIEAASVVDGDVVGDNLILTQHDGTQINAGNVRGPQGIQGPVSADLVVATAKPILDVGAVGQIRAGRQLTAADFTNMGLQAPLGLWNLSDLTDVSGNGRNLLNKNAVTFASGINGAATTAAQFRGASGTPANDAALYIPDDATGTQPGAAFRIKTGSWGTWQRTAKRGSIQYLLSKMGTQYAFASYVDTNNVASTQWSFDGTGVDAIYGSSDVADDRWHFIVTTFDGTVWRIYVDGILEGQKAVSGLIFSANVSLNIGASGASASLNPGSPHYGRIDEAFVTNEVLTEDQIRILYCAKIPHTLAVVPTRVTLNVRRRRRTSLLAVADFTTQPLRMYNFSAGSLGDEGSANLGLTNNGGAVLATAVDGTKDNAFYFPGAANLSAPNTGLPAGVAGAVPAHSYGAWFKTVVTAASMGIVAWGTGGSTRPILYLNATCQISCVTAGNAYSGPFVGDGLWHHAIVVVNETAPDGVKTKLYLDGRLVVGGTHSPAITLGANLFRIGCDSDAGIPWNGMIDGVFVAGYAMTADEIYKLYAKGAQALAPSPKNVGDHIEGMTSTDLLATFDTLESQYQVDLGVA